MSFSSHTKDELLQLIPEKEHCALAELAAILCLEDLSQNSIAEERKEYLLSRLSSPVQKSDLVSSDGTVPEKYLQRPCCKRAYLRGIFYIHGCVTDPEKNYHMEIVCPDEKLERQVFTIMEALDLKPKSIERKGHYVIYLKEADRIADFLGLIHANVALLVWENVRVTKDVRNSVNRQVNCETANLSKTVSAGVEQVRLIEAIRNKIGFESLPANLREIAVLRLDNPDSSLVELGQLLDPPVGKSGVNHRMRKLRSIAEEENIL